MPLELVELSHPEDRALLFAMVEKKAAQWCNTAEEPQGATALVIRNHHATTGGKGYDNIGGDGNGAWIPCSFHLQGFCQLGQNCQFAHTDSNNFQHAGPSGPSAKGGQPQELPFDACRICGQVTNPPHWGKECKFRNKGKGKEGKARMDTGLSGKGAWIGTGHDGLDGQMGAGFQTMDGWIGATSTEYPPDSNEYGKRARIGAGALKNSSSLGGVPAAEPEISFDQLTEIAQKFMDQQKQAYKKATEMLQQAEKEQSSRQLFAKTTESLGTVELSICTRPEPTSQSYGDTFTLLCSDVTSPSLRPLSYNHVPLG